MMVMMMIIAVMEDEAQDNVNKKKGEKYQPTPELGKKNNAQRNSA